MESNFRDNEFEHYLKQNADQYRMFPSEKVWKGINSTLHTRRKWYGFWLGALLLLTGGAVTWVMTTQPGIKSNPGSVINHELPSQSIESTQKTGDDAEVIYDLNPFAERDGERYRFIPGPVEASAITETAFVDPSLETIVNTLPFARLEEPAAGSELSATLDRINITEHLNFITESAPAVTPAETSGSDQQRHAASPAPYTIESVTNSYEYKRPARKISWQLFVTPTISYRKLSLNKSSDNPSAYNYPFASLSDINNAVTHKPDMGLQIGLSGRYPITKNVKLRGGVQFNINRYDIKAYAFNGEVATIDLNGGSGNSSISTWTYYRNYAGYKSDWLKNYYFSVSAPFGAEIKLFGNEKTNFGIAGTLQPTYIIKDRAYLISTDYKNYAEVPRLIRHVNLNTSFETFVNYTNRKTKWQIGPQVRYQVLSSFHNKYPVKENLFDFGVKIGVTLNE